MDAMARDAEEAEAALEEALAEAEAVIEQLRARLGESHVRTGREGEGEGEKE